MEHFGAAIPKGRERAPFLRPFVSEARADGTVAAAIQPAGLRGTVAKDGK